MKFSVKKSVAGIVATLFMFSLSPIALAGGSSYEFTTYVRSGLVKTGSTLPEALRINVQVYMNPNIFKMNQIGIKTVKISCEGDDALESAQLKLGNTVLASTNFVPSTLASNWHKALLQPPSLILDNDTVHNLGIDLKSRPNLKGNQVVICEAEILEHDKMYNNALADVQDLDFANIDQDNRAMIVATDSGKLFSSDQNYRFLDMTQPVYFGDILTISGTVSKVKTGQYQISTSFADWGKAGLYNVMIPYLDLSPVKFDITSPRFFTTEQLKPYKTFSIQEMHLYDQPAANGSVGKITLK